MPRLLRRTTIALASLVVAAALTTASASARGQHRRTSSSEAAVPAAEESLSAPPTESTPPPAGESSPTPGPEPGPTSPGETNGLPPSSRPHQHANRGDACTLSAQMSAASVMVGESASLSGQLSCPSGTDAGGEPITVLLRERGTGGGLVEVATVTSGGDGSYEVTSEPLTANGVFVVRSSVARSVRASVAVTPAVTLAGPAADGAELAARASGAGRGGRLDRFTFTGTVTPNASGARVALQREYLATGERWHTIGFTRVDDEGRFSFTRGFRSTGEVAVRVTVHVKGEEVTDAEPITYDITQAQNPELTIQAAANPVVSGKSTTITGVAAGAPGQSLTLLGRTPGQAFTPVAQDSSGAGGAYSFEVTPLKNTVYEVRDGAGVSSELLEGVAYELSLEAPPDPLSSGVSVSFTGTVLPAPTGQIVHLERERASGGEHFQVVATTSVDAASSYSIPYTFAQPGSYRMRISTPPAQGMLAGTGKALEVTVTAPALAEPGAR
jgi:hypothetical protein